MTRPGRRDRRRIAPIAIGIGIALLIVVAVMIAITVSDDDDSSSPDSSLTSSTTVAPPGPTTPPGTFGEVEGPTPTLAEGATVTELPRGGEVRVSSPQDSAGETVTTLQIAGAPAPRTLTVESIEAIIPGQDPTIDPNFVPIDVAAGTTRTIVFRSPARPSAFSVRVQTEDGSRVYRVGVPTG